MSLTEKRLIQSIRKASYRGARAGNLGIGDDCAVIKLPRGHERWSLPISAWRTSTSAGPGIRPIRSDTAVSLGGLAI